MAVRVDSRELQALAGRRRRADAARNVHHEHADVDREALAAALRRELRGDVRFDEAYRAAYSTDSSNYRFAPLGVVCARDAADVEAAVAVCRRFGAAITARGAGTSLAGQTTNAAVILDCGRHMREIVAIDAQRRIARVQPGVVRDQLAKRCERDHGLSFPPDTSTHAYATFGGMIANNSCGAHSVMTGRTSDNLEALDVLLYDGTRLAVGATSDAELEAIVAAGGRRGELYSRLRDLRDRHAALIRARYPQIPRRVSGYNLDELLPERGFHVARALAGSEGTLALTLEATVRLTPWPRARALLVLGYQSIFDAADHVPEVMQTGPMACEAIDDVLVEDMRRQGMHPKDIPLLPGGGGWLIAEYGGATRAEADAMACAAQRRLEGVADAHMYDDPDDEDRLWKVREAGLGATAYLPGAPDHYEGWEDAAVPPERLGDYLRDFQALLERHRLDTSKYGHFGQGLVHCRINFRLLSADGVRDFRAFLDEAAELVVRHGGSLSGEHGDGQSRGALLETMYGRELIQAFREYKAIWDPARKLNPGKLVDAYDPAHDLKLGTDHRPRPQRTHFAYAEDEGSFAHAAARCVGAGKCLDIAEGTMCPSYMATLDEQHTTRGRARILFEMLRGETVSDGWRSDGVHEALDLCLACKGCKGDCPVSVDMATYKAEFLAHHYRRRLRPRPAYAMGLIMFHARVAARAPRAANLLTQTPGVRALLQRAAGLTAQRRMPAFAPETFRSWWARRGGSTAPGPAVVLWADTFTNHFEPHVAQAAVRVLEAAGHRVVVPRQALCCGRPLYDYGMLPTARRHLNGVLRALRPHLEAGTPVVGLEPSCVAVFRDELTGLLPDDQDARRLASQARTLAEQLRADGWTPPPLHARALLHGHCHQKAVIGVDADVELLEAMGVELERGGEYGAGCCGLAGSFGYEAPKHELSMRIGERGLLPGVRALPPDTLVIADGFSCRSQIRHATDRQPLHLAEVVAGALG